ncbi:hypothetical protein CF335_g8703, partial [Tilletia laevis]
LIDLEKVQVHPTGLVDPKDPDAKVKFFITSCPRSLSSVAVSPVSVPPTLSTSVEPTFLFSTRLHPFFGGNSTKATSGINGAGGV